MSRCPGLELRLACERVDRTLRAARAHSESAEQLCRVASAAGLPATAEAHVVGAAMLVAELELLQGTLHRLHAQA